MFLPEYVFYADFSPFINCETCSGSRIRTNRFKNQMGTHVRIKDFKIKKKIKCFSFLSMCACFCRLSCVRHFGTSWTVAHPAPLSMEFSRQEYWRGLPHPTRGFLPNPGIVPIFLHWQADSLSLCHPKCPFSK